MKKNHKILIIFLLVLFVQAVPLLVSADIGIPCARTPDPTTGKLIMCSFNDVFVLINNVIKFFLKVIVLPFIILLITYAGFLLMTSAGNEEKRTTAKNILFNIVKGLLLILFSWFIIYTLFTAFGYDTSNGRAGLSNGFIKWNTSGQVSTIINPSTNTNTTTNQTVNKYEGIVTVNIADPAKTRVTVEIDPKAPSIMPIVVNCYGSTGDFRSTEGKIATDSNTTTVELKLLTASEYSCQMENTEGTLSGDFSITIP